MAAVDMLPRSVKLTLDSLEINNFRGLRSLQIPKLGRVNLITGKNNVGKSSVLEALIIYATRGEPAALFKLLEDRDELRHFETDNATRKLADAEERAEALKHLFNNSDSSKRQTYSSRIGNRLSRDGMISLNLSWGEWDQNAAGYREFKLLEPKQHSLTSGLTPALNVKVGDYLNYDFPLDQSYSPKFFREVARLKDIRCTYDRASSLHPGDVAAYWDSIALSDLEDEVLLGLQLIAPNVIGVSFIGSGDAGKGRIPVVRVKDIDERLPLRSMGDGMIRIFGIILCLVNASQGFVLIDEIENGLHYSVLADVWRLVFRIAHRLNVQVFATTHSWDCVQAFQQAAEGDEEGEGTLIRLQNQNGDVTATVFDERRLAVVTREQIEVR